MDIIDYGVEGLWKKAIDGAGVTVAYVVTNPDPNLQASMATYDTAMDLPPADITDMALPAPTDPSAVCQIECSTGEDRLDAEAIHSMAPFAKMSVKPQRATGGPVDRQPGPLQPPAHVPAGRRR